MNEEIAEMMNELDEKKLLHLNSSIIKDAKNNILQRMSFERSELKHYHKILKGYRFIDELDELSLGRHIRWFDITKVDNLKLYAGAILLDIEYTTDNIYLVCKGYRNQMFKIKMSKIVLFQKLTSQELLLIQILDYIQDK